MIGYLRGRIRARTERTVLVEVGGMGYEVHIPERALALLPPSDAPVELHTHLVWREDAISLYGFPAREERDAFRLLLEVSGVGPRLAMGILSALSVEELLSAIAANDARRLQSIHGVGKRTAARLCVDLRDKARSLAIPEIPAETGETGSVSAKGGMFEDCLAALMNLGYRESEARPAMERAARELESGTRLEDLLRHTLQLLAR